LMCFSSGHTATMVIIGPLPHESWGLRQVSRCPWECLHRPHLPQQPGWCSWFYRCCIPNSWLRWWGALKEDLVACGRAETACGMRVCGGGVRRAACRRATACGWQRKPVLADGVLGGGAATDN
jgi:hypothetical protein